MALKHKAVVSCWLMPAAAEPLPIATEVGERVREYRQKRKWSQLDLANKLGTDMSYVSHVENGRQNITITTLVRISSALEIDPARLVRGLTMNPKTRVRTAPITKKRR